MPSDCIVNWIRTNMMLRLNGPVKRRSTKMILTNSFYIPPARRKPSHL